MKRRHAVLTIHTKVAALILISTAAFASTATFNISQFANPGKAQTVETPSVDYSAVSPGVINGAAAGRALAGLAATDNSNLRGAREVDVYRRISPSVVLVNTNDGFGSGSVISAYGEIITSWHVVKGYSKVGVIFKPNEEGQPVHGSRAFVADVLRHDEVADLALLKLESMPGTMPAAVQFGDFDKVSVGDDVDAIGHPSGEAWTFTKGYVSQIRKGFQWHADDGVSHSADVIQTQTPINPGNSGGPLLNANGLLFGINAFKDEGEGLNFAIGVDEIRRFIASGTDRVAQQESTTSSDCKPRTIFEGRNSNDDASIRQIDTECHGNIDGALVIPDDKAKPIYCFFYDDKNGKLFGIAESRNRDFKWDISFWDKTETGVWDTIGYHPDGKLVPSSFGPNDGTQMP
jgi:S1-C subfamily serine protease